MKKIIMAAVFAAGLFATGAKAQDAQQGMDRNATPEQRAQRQTDQMAKNLSLTEDQKKKVYEVTLKNVQERQQQRQSGQRPDRDAMQAKMKETDAQYKAILNADQYQKYEKLKEERMGQMRQGGGRGGRGGNGGNGGDGGAPAGGDGGMQ